MLALSVLLLSRDIAPEVAVDGMGVGIRSESQPYNPICCLLLEHRRRRIAFSIDTALLDGSPISVTGEWGLFVGLLAL